jgi:hypothetical protein
LRQLFSDDQRKFCGRQLHVGQKWNADFADKALMNADFFELSAKIRGFLFFEFLLALN